MAHGFERERGTGRGYVNRSNSDFITGLRLSRRQYDAYVSRIGARKRSATVGELREAVLNTRNAMRDARARMKLAEAQGEAQIAAARAEAVETEAQFAATERKLAARARTDAGGRWYVTYRKAWVDARRAEGETISLRQATHDPRFLADWNLARGIPNPKGNELIAARNRRGRDLAVARAGGWRNVREDYDKKYGQRPLVVRRSGGVRR